MSVAATPTITRHKAVVTILVEVPSPYLGDLLDAFQPHQSQGRWISIEPPKDSDDGMEHCKFTLPHTDVPWFENFLQQFCSTKGVELLTA